MLTLPKCPLCGSLNICNVYMAKTYEYYNDVDDYSYTDEVEDFLHSLCEDCGAKFAKKIEDFREEK